MSDTDQVQRMDLDTLTDDEVMSLDSDQVQALMDQEGEADVVETNEEENNDNPESDTDTDTNDESDGSESNSSDDNSTNESNEDKSLDSSEPESVPTEESTEDKTPSSGEHSEVSDSKTESDKSQKSEKPNEKEPAKAEDNSKEKDDKSKSPTDGFDEKQVNTAVDFFKKVSAPFKADGREIQVRTPEDAIRLMQMGVNYSRRMQEMKPLRALDHMLTQHGLKDPEKLSELIDISKGNPKAIEKFLKDKGIDPLDFDTSKDNGYKTPNYQGDPKDLEFKEAIDNVLTQPGGRELLIDVNDNWDEQSKSALRDQPAIFQNILEQKNSGVYGKIIEELNYQRTMGFLTNVPFLQAYHQVGDAMQKAGVFGSPEPKPHSGGAEMQIRQKNLNTVPIDTGPRKAASKPKTTQPNPSLSSTQPPRSTPSSGENQEPDYSTLSDEEFLKLGLPS